MRNGINRVARSWASRRPALVLALLAGGWCSGWAQAPGAAPTTGGAVSNPDQTTRAEQKSNADSAAKAEEAQEAVPAPTNAGVLLDRVVAVVNGDVVLESDVEEERRMTVFQPISSPDGNASREKAIERLVNRKTAAAAGSTAAAACRDGSRYRCANGSVTKRDSGM